MKEVAGRDCRLVILVGRADDARPVRKDGRHVQFACRYCGQPQWYALLDLVRICLDHVPQETLAACTDCIEPMVCERIEREHTKITMAGTAEVLAVLDRWLEDRDLQDPG